MPLAEIIETLEISACSLKEFIECVLVGLRIAAKCDVRTGKRIKGKVDYAEMIGLQLLGEKHSADLAPSGLP